MACAVRLSSGFNVFNVRTVELFGNISAPSNSSGSSQRGSLRDRYNGRLILILIVVRTYPRVCPRRCGTRCEAAAYAAKPQATRRSRGLASCRGKAARGEAEYNLVSNNFRL